MSDGDEPTIKTKKASKVTVRLELGANEIEALDHLRNDLGRGQRGLVVRDAVQAYTLIHGLEKSGRYFLIFDPNKNIIEQVRISGKTAPLSETPILISSIESRKQAAVYARVLIESLKEIIPDSKRNYHNSPPIDLRVTNDSVDVKDVKILIAELRKLNKLLLDKGTKVVPDDSKILINRHLNKFLDAFAGTAGKGSAYLMIGAAASLLTYLGMGSELAGSVLNKIR